MLKRLLEKLREVVRDILYPEEMKPLPTHPDMKHYQMFVVMRRKRSLSQEGEMSRARWIALKEQYLRSKYHPRRRKVNNVLTLPARRSSLKRDI